AEHEIPVRIVNGHLYVKADINGISGVFNLDTGANSSILDIQMIHRAGVPDGEIKRLKASASPRKRRAEKLLSTGSAVSLHIATFTLAQILMNDATMYFLPWADIRKSFRKYDGVDVDGIIGVDILKLNSFALDYGSGTATFYPSDKPFQFDAGIILPLDKDSLRRDIPLVRLSKDGGSPRSFLVDTGASGFLVSRKAFNEWKVGEGMSGLPAQWKRTPGREYRFKSLSLDQMQLRNVRCFVPDGEGLPSKDLDGIMGNSVLESFGRVTFDFQSTRLLLGP
ncbi:MAG: retropepsin-like aspartic protease, partial [Actinomycetota bacterium]